MVYVKLQPSEIVLPGSGRAAKPGDLAIDDELPEQQARRDHRQQGAQRAEEPHGPQRLRESQAAHAV